MINDLIVTPQPEGTVLLEWTEVNTGDYDFNGEVNITDLAPLGQLVGERIDRGSPHAALSEVFWVDGDRNGEVNLNDLTPIGQNYQSKVTGYVIRRNGHVVVNTDGGEPTVKREDALVRPHLPNKYSILLDGNVSDFWEVAPVDQKGFEGTNNTGIWNVIDLKATLSIDGVALQDFNTPELLGGLENNSYRLKIIDLAELQRRLMPGIIPDGYHVGDGFDLGIGSAAFAGLPRGQTLVLEVLYRPEYNLATGEPWTDEDIVEGHNDVRTYFPFTLPEEGVMELDANIRVSKKPTGGAVLGLEAITRSGEGTGFVVKQLDYGNGLISQDTDLDASFADEAKLADDHRLGLSLARLTGMIDYEDDTYNARVSQTVYGRLSDVVEPDGTITLLDAVTLDTGGLWAVGEITVNFDESTAFEQVTCDPNGEVTGDVTPSELALSDYLCLTTDYLVDPTGGSPEKHWASAVRRKVLTVADDALCVVPAKTTVRPGEAVLVTVYANRTANPFFALGGLALSLDEGNYFRHGSFNTGEPGGAAGGTDGLWLMTGASSFVLPPDALITGQPYGPGRVVLGFSLTPQNGQEIELATGALFNFELICHHDADLAIVRDAGSARTFYLDRGSNEYHWAHDEDAEIPAITVVGDPLVLSLVIPPADGDGTQAGPYLVTGGTGYEIMLIDPLSGNVTLSPGTVFTVEPAEAAAVAADTGMLTFSPAYTGDVLISASYGNIHTNPAQGLNFVVGE